MTPLTLVVCVVFASVVEDGEITPYMLREQRPNVVFVIVIVVIVEDGEITPNMFANDVRMQK